MRTLLFCLTGDSILFSETTAEWKSRRKALSPAFYKGKLVHMVEIARESVKFTIDHLKSKMKDNSLTGKAKISLINEMSDMSVRILVMCAFGEDISQS